jgi:hypothetical protein
MAEHGKPKIVRLQPAGVPLEQPDQLSEPEALNFVRSIAVDTNNIVVLFHANKQAKKRGITHRQIELCVQKGTMQEGPFVNGRGNWQMNLYRHAAGEEITCVVAIEWATKVLVISTF